MAMISKADSRAENPDNSQPEPHVLSVDMGFKR